MSPNKSKTPHLKQPPQTPPFWSAPSSICAIQDPTINPDGIKYTVTDSKYQQTLYEALLARSEDVLVGGTGAKYRQAWCEALVTTGNQDSAGVKPRVWSVARRPAWWGGLDLQSNPTINLVVRETKSYPSKHRVQSWRASLVEALMWRTPQAWCEALVPRRNQVVREGGCKCGALQGLHSGEAVLTCG